MKLGGCPAICHRAFNRQLYSIRTRFVLLIALVITFVYGFVTINQIQETSPRLEKELQQQALLLAEVHAEALADALWNLNIDSINRQLNLLVTNRDIVSVEVKEPNNELFATAISDWIRDQDVASIDKQLHITQPINHINGEIIGHLSISVSRQRIDLENARLIRSQLKDFAIVVLVVTLAVALTVTSLVRPIISITQTMTKLAEGELDTKIPETTRRDEIGDMARTLEVFKANAEYVQVSLDKERELSGLQRQFVSMVSHEFRTPLAVIDGNAQRLLRRIDRIGSDRLREGLSKVRKAVVNLTDLMESVLNAAKLEEGRVEYRPEVCDLHSLLSEVCASYAEINGNHKLIVEIDQLPRRMMADRRLLRQVFSNLLSNAIKYAPNATTVWVTSELCGDRELTISVRDEGLGIPPEELEKLFDRFFRASTSTGIAGSGIGLHLVKHFVDLHNGTVEVESTVNVGTTFCIRLPVVEAEDELIVSAA